MAKHGAALEIQQLKDAALPGAVGGLAQNSKIGWLLKAMAAEYSDFLPGPLSGETQQAQGCAILFVTSDSGKMEDSSNNPLRVVQARDPRQNSSGHPLSQTRCDCQELRLPFKTTR
jgi:hypothetical protein